MIPKTGGIYYLYSKRMKLVYIGKANNLRHRLVIHKSDLDSFNNWIKFKRPSLSFSAKPFEYIRYTIINDEFNRTNIEKSLINEIGPKYNGWQIEYKNPKYEKNIWQDLANKMR